MPDMRRVRNERSVLRLAYREWLAVPYDRSRETPLPIRVCGCGDVFLHRHDGHPTKLCRECRSRRNLALSKESAGRTKARDPAAYLAARRQKSREWRARNPSYRSPPESAEKSRARKLERKYGLSVDEYSRMLAAQGGVCALCGRPDLPGKRLAVDHCHRTRAVRGLLCALCNTALGKFNDSVAMLTRAVEYLRRYECQN